MCKIVLQQNRPNPEARCAAAICQQSKQDRTHPARVPGVENDPMQTLIRE